MRWRLFRYALIVPALALAAAGARAQLPEITVSINGHKLSVEVAHTEPSRTQGLMHRRMLPENRGMLFVFAETAHHGMWMMNTYIPLSVAFLDASGVIINIADMEPHTRDSHMAARPARYALEVNHGWFKKRGIGPGARVEGLERAPPAR
ncbi:MAG: DUF192 domain-containing protein [Betaproteobacteria bacterium]|nr:DUF192 domain-containing protein [Betaproteobacteria bacterium]